jgi:hypothetical protein
MEILEPVRNGTPEVSALCSAGISNGLERIRRGTEFTEAEQQECGKIFAFSLRSDTKGKRAKSKVLI